MSNTTMEKTKPTNDLGYLEVDWKKIRPMGDRILVDWDEANDKIGSGLLVRAETHKKLHYTGIVLAVGSKVESPDIKAGARILFDQFSNFEKLFDPELGRLALISEQAQGSAFTIVPPRTKVGPGEGDFNYDL